MVARCIRSQVTLPAPWNGEQLPVKSWYFSLRIIPPPTKIVPGLSFFGTDYYPHRPTLRLPTTAPPSAFPTHHLAALRPTRCDTF